jgi:hypothetical protein
VQCQLKIHPYLLLRSAKSREVSVHASRQVALLLAPELVCNLVRKERCFTRGCNKSNQPGHLSVTPRAHGPEWLPAENTPRSGVRIPCLYLHDHFEGQLTSDIFSLPSLERVWLQITHYHSQTCDGILCDFQFMVFCTRTDGGAVFLVTNQRERSPLTAACALRTAVRPSVAPASRGQL